MGTLPSTSAFKKERAIIASQVAKLRRFYKESTSFTSSGDASGETQKIEDDVHRWISSTYVLNIKFQRSIV